MDEFVKFVARNDWLVAAATLTSIISFLVILCPSLWRFLLFAYDVITRGLARARYALRRNTAKTARLCFESPSYFVVYLFIRAVTMFLFMAFTMLGGLTVLMTYMIGPPVFSPVLAVRMFLFTGVTILIVWMPFAEVLPICNRVSKLAERRSKQFRARYVPNETRKTAK